MAGDGLRILVADDDPSIIEFINLCLADQIGIKKLFFAEDGSIATRKMENQAFDVVIMDIEMPKVNGIKAISDMVGQRILRADQFIIISAHLKSEEIQAALKLGVTNILVKPLTKEKILEKLNVVATKMKFSVEFSS